MRLFIFKYKPLVFLLAFVFCKSYVFAQPAQKYSYQYYNTSHGLPSTQITCLAKDNKGFLWIGTSAGISMYDGYIFKNYAYTKDNEFVGHINVIRLQKPNRLWIGSAAGLFCLENNKIIKISVESKLPQGVNDIFLEQDGNAWLATENGPVNFNIRDADFTGKKKLALTAYLHKEWKQDDKSIKLISKAPDGTIYFSGDNNLFRLYGNKIELLHTTTGDRNKITTLFPLSKTKIYFDAVSSELCRFENGITTAVGYNNFYNPGLNITSPGEWYVGTRGAFYFSPKTGIASRQIIFADRYFVWASAVLEDEGFFWVASYDGLIKLKPSVFTTYQIEKTGGDIDYYSFKELRNGKLLLGANHGKIFEKKDNRFTLLKENVFASAEIKSLYEDERGWIWAAGGYQGLAVLRNGRTERFTVEDGLHDNSISGFLKTSGNKFYTIGDRGISEITIESDEAISFKKFIFPPNATKHAKFFSAIEGPAQTIWLAGEEGMLYLRNDSLHPFLWNGKQLSVNFLIRDKEDKIWIATSGNGILQAVFNSQNELEIVKQFSENDGLNSNHYLTLLADIDNNIWAGSSKGLTLIGQQDKYKNRILNFDESDGFIKAGYSYIRLAQASNGTIWAATVFGITSFNPLQLNLSDAPPVVYITSVRQIERNNSGNDKILDDVTGKSIYSSSDNSFSFTFTAMDYVNQENIRYYYKLDGLDTNWTSTGNLRNISFENLSPGYYSFRVKALNSKSIWSKQDAVYNFSITPPFWKTWWFITLLLFSIAALSILLVRKRIQFVKAREEQKTALQKLRATNYREQLEIEQIINYFATSISNVNSIDEILWDVTKNCISRLKFEDCVIYLADAKRNVLVQKAAWGPKTTEENKILNPIEIMPGYGIVGSIAVSGQAEIINDTSIDDRYIIDDIKRLSEIAVPIMQEGKVIGIIDSEHSQKNFYTERHLQILTTIASLCAGKIETIKAEQQSREKEMEVLRLSKDFATSQLTALRMQMNPHFIFNALNSVQHYILQGNVIEANKYLSKFSKLQREILHCSNLQFITLEKEIEILNSYLQLEQFRFGESFIYQINMTNEIEPVEIKIPPMMLQPFVENAIWHGLMPLQTDRNLSIQFDLYTDDILVAIIRDNGIGRTASAKLKHNNGSIKAGYESKGMSMVQQRLDLLQQQYDRPFDAAISDITDINGLVKGTQVTLKIFIGNKKA